MRPHTRLTLLLSGLWTLCAILAAGSFVTGLRMGTIRMSGNPTAWDAVRSQITPWIAVILLTPALVWWCARFPAAWRTGAVAAHLFGLPIFAVLYMLLNIGIALALQARHPMMPSAAAMGGRIISSAVLITAKYTIVVIAATADFYFRETVRRAQEAERMKLARAELERDLAGARLHALRTQLQPHFLFNALNAVSGLIDEDAGAARRALARIGDLLRLVLDRTEQASLTLQEELDLAERYVEIERVRFGDRLRVRYDVPSELLGAMIPSFAIQPLIENAIRHGISRRETGGSVEVTAHADAAWLELQVVNDMSGAISVNRERVGLGTLRSRLGAMYGSRARLVAGPRPDGRFAAILTIPRR
jgi:two-component system, LytTR family, sensor kinase